MNRIFTRLIIYFTGLMIFTCFATSSLFFLTAGRSMGEDIHRLIRKQVHFIAELTNKALHDDGSDNRLTSMLEKTADAYELSIGVLNSDNKQIAASKNHWERSGTISEEMMLQVDTAGVFVNPGHFSGKTEYLLPLSPYAGKKRYIHIVKQSKSPESLPILITGLIFLCLILTLAIYRLSRSFTKPISSLSNALESIAEGRFDETIAIDKREDELGKLLRTFRKMSRSVSGAIESKKKFLADISHELRSPLGRMSANLELINEEMHNTEVDKYTGMMFQEIDYMTGLVRSLSAYAKINLPDYKPETEMISPPLLVDDLFERYQPVMAKKGFIFHKSIDGETPPVSMDTGLVSRALCNFLDNACQYCNPGGTITLGINRSENGTDFFVEDSGTGIPENLKESVFEPLFRADPSRSRETGGTGLGLSICKQVAELHGGRVDYQRQEGKTVFRLVLPH